MLLLVNPIKEQDIAVSEFNGTEVPDAEPCDHKARDPSEQFFKAIQLEWPLGRAGHHQDRAGLWDGMQAGKHPE
jgi:hypothetical protein